MNRQQLEKGYQKLKLLKAARRNKIISDIEKMLRKEVNSYYDRKIQCGYERLYFDMLCLALHDVLRRNNGCNHHYVNTAMEYIIEGCREHLDRIGLDMDYMHLVLKEAIEYEY